MRNFVPEIAMFFEESAIKCFSVDGEHMFKFVAQSFRNGRTYKFAPRDVIVNNGVQHLF